MYAVSNVDLRAMAIFYLAESPLVPDLETDYYLSPIIAPLALLAKFPKTYMICGENDPLVDDTIIFMNRLRQAQSIARQSDPSLPADECRVKILPGMSHGFFQCYSFLPEAKQATRLTSTWFLELFMDGEVISEEAMNQVEEGVLLKRRRKELASVLFRDQEGVDVIKGRSF